VAVEQRIGMRFRPEKATGTSPVWTVPARMWRVLDPAHSILAPSARQTSTVIATSPMLGTLWRTTSSSVSRLATICLVAAFLAPLARMEPRRGDPPSIR
jgi:hypothetical protein